MCVLYPLLLFLKPIFIFLLLTIFLMWIPWSRPAYTLTKSSLELNWRAVLVDLICQEGFLENGRLIIPRSFGTLTSLFWSLVWRLLIIWKVLTVPILQDLVWIYWYYLNYCIRYCIKSQLLWCKKKIHFIIHHQKLYMYWYFNISPPKAICIDISIFHHQKLYVYLYFNISHCSST